MDKASNLRPRHFEKCQHYLTDDESGFLKNGQLPETGVEEFRMMMSLMGMSEKATKPMKKEGKPNNRYKSIRDDETSSLDSESKSSSDEEDDSNKSSSPIPASSPLVPNEASNFSQETFGEASEVIQTLSQLPEEGHNCPTQRDINGFFEKCQRNGRRQKDQKVQDGRGSNEAKS